MKTMRTPLISGREFAETPWTFAAAAGILLFVAAAAGFIPAARASRISPISALRSE
jgi:ABC-type antimicrobial peptide transport system permease subunit